jgi:hypothetical protein
VHKRDVGNRAGEHGDRPGYVTKMTNPHVEYLGHHWILLAVPAFLPAVIVVGVVLYVALRDRRAGPSAGGATPDHSNQRSDAADEKRD